MFKHLINGLTMLLLLFSTSLFAQTDFVAIYGDANNNIFNEVKFDETSGFYFAAGASNERAAVSKIDHNGELLWTEVYGPEGSYFESLEFTPIETDGSRDIIVAGLAPISDTQNGIFYGRLDFDGNWLWAGGSRIRSLDNNPGLGFLRRVKVLASNPVVDKYLITATVDRVNTVLLKDELLSLRISGVQGNVELSSTYTSGNVADDQVYDLISNDWGGAYFCGTTEPRGGGSSEAFYGQFFNNGNTGLTTDNRFEFNNTLGSRFLSMSRTADDGFIFAGSNQNNSTQGDGIILKLDALGNFEWHRTIQDNFPFTSIIGMDDGHIVAARNKGNILELITIDAAGNLVQAQIFDNVDPNANNLRLEKTGGQNELVIAYTTVVNPGIGYGGQDPLLIVIDPLDTQLNCLAKASQASLSDPLMLVSRFNLIREGMTTSRTNDNSSAPEDWADNKPCAEKAQAKTQTTASDLLLQESKSTIFPNPAQDQLTVRIEKGNLSHVQLKNVNGQSAAYKILSSDAKTMELDLGHLPAGLYFMELYNESAKIDTQRLTIL